MNATVSIPGELAERLSAGGDMERHALQALALEAYRAARITKPELRRALGFACSTRSTPFSRRMACSSPPPSPTLNASAGARPARHLRSLAGCRRGRRAAA